MKLYYRGGRISDHMRMIEDDTIMSRDLAPKQVEIDKFVFFLNPSDALGGGLIYDCINEHMKDCEDCCGRGQVTCPHCDGFGEMDCEECDATGSVEDLEKLEEKERLRMEAEETKREVERNQIPLELS